MIHWTTVLFGIICCILLYLTFKNHGEGGGYGDISAIVNIFFGIILLAFIAIWGGIFWW